MDYISNLSGRSWVKIEILCVMTNQKLSIRNLSGREILFAKEGPTLAKKLWNFVDIWVGFEYEPELSSMLLKRCSGSFLEIICFMTDHVFLKSELTESSLSWKNFFLASLMRKLYVLRYLLYSRSVVWYWCGVFFKYRCHVAKFALRRPRRVTYEEIK